MTNEDKSLITEVINGNIESFRYIIEKYDKKVYSFIYEIIHDSYLAQDLTQIAFIKAYENIHRFNIEKNFLTWLLTIAKNATLNEIKKSKKEFSLSNNTHLLSLYKNKTFKIDPQNIYEHKEDSLELYSVIDSLPYKYKVLIILKYIENLSYKEISCELNIPISKVESRLHTARKKLLNKIERSSNRKEDFIKCIVNHQEN